MVAALPCGCELRRVDAFDRLFGLGTLDRRRSGSVTALSAPRHDRSAGGRRFAGFLLRCEAREATCWIGHDFTVVLNIQGTETRRRARQVHVCFERCVEEMKPRMNRAKSFLLRMNWIQ